MPDGMLFSPPPGYGLWGGSRRVDPEVFRWIGDEERGWSGGVAVVEEGSGRRRHEPAGQIVDENRARIGTGRRSGCARDGGGPPGRVDAMVNGDGAPPVYHYGGEASRSWISGRAEVVEIGTPRAGL